jgi:hypothetical protein
MMEKEWKCELNVVPATSWCSKLQWDTKPNDDDDDGDVDPRGGKVRKVWEKKNNLLFW